MMRWRYGDEEVQSVSCAAPDAHVQSLRHEPRVAFSLNTCYAIGGKDDSELKFRNLFK